jgi:hypothetical protein
MSAEGDELPATMKALRSPTFNYYGVGSSTVDALHYLLR